MNLDVIKYLLPIGAVSLGLGMLLGWPSKKERKQFDERQLIERGKAALLSMNTLTVYILLAYCGMELHMIPQEHMLPMVLFGLVLSLMVNNTYCIFHDAFLRRSQNAVFEMVGWLVLSGLWFLMAHSNWERAPQLAWIDLMVGLEYGCQGLCLLLRRIYLSFRDRREDEE